MLRVAIFTEGQSELIFTREFLHRLFRYENVHIKCLQLNSGNEFVLPHEIRYPTPNCYIQICNIGNDSKVASYIINQYKRLKEQNFEIIIGLRDVFSDEYKKKSDSIDWEIIHKFINVQNSTIQKFTNDNEVEIFFAIMEFESWLLSFNNFFEKIDPRLTDKYILEQLNIEIANICPDDVFYHPTNKIDEILKLAEIKYNKSKGQINSFVQHIISLQDTSNFDAIDSSSTSLNKYHSFLVQIYNTSLTS